MRGSYILPAESSGSRLGRPGGLLLSGLLAILLASQARSALAGAPPTSTPTVTPTTTPTVTRTPTLTPTSNRVSDLSVEKSASPDPVRSGETLTYTLIIRNNGPNLTFTASASDPLPPQVVFLSCSPVVPYPNSFCGGPPVGSNGSVSIQFTNLTGGTQTFLIAVRVIASSGTIVNTASVSGFSADPNLDNNHATVTTTIEPGPTPSPTPPAVTALSPGGLALFAMALMAVAYTLIRRGS